MSAKPVIVVSATRFFQGGTLVIVAECLKFLSEHYSTTHTIKALVYKKALYEQMDPRLHLLEGVEWIEYPKARKSALHRLYQEYISFGKSAVKWQPVLWLSLQDSTPRVKATVRAVYFHNPLLEIPLPLLAKFWKHQPRLALLRLLYKYIYTRGIKNNDFVITQQAGIAALLEGRYGLERSKIRVFPPASFLLNSTGPLNYRAESKPLGEDTQDGTQTKQRPYTFIFPATAFYYKNHALILAACRLLNDQLSESSAHEQASLNYQVILTIDGSENRHVQQLALAAQKELPQIQFAGFLKRTLLYAYYKKADCMIFPSLLESWGLPLSEFAAQDKPVLCADLSYGRSTLRDYNKAVFFDPENEKQLAALMHQAITGKLNFQGPDNRIKQDYQILNSWEALFQQLLDSGH